MGPRCSPQGIAPWSAGWEKSSAGRCGSQGPRVRDIGTLQVANLQLPFQIFGSHRQHFSSRYQTTQPSSAVENWAQMAVADFSVLGKVILTQLQPSHSGALPFNLCPHWITALVLWPHDVRANTLEKTLMLGKIEGGRRRGQQMVGWHQRLDGHKFEQTLGDGEGQGGLTCCSPWGRKESDML